MKKLLKFFTLLLAISIIISNTGVISSYAIPNVSIDDDIYNLYVDEYPDDVSNGIYAKFKSSKSNVDDYYLNLSAAEDEEVFEKALKSAGIKLNDNNIATSFTATLYLTGDDDDIKKTDAVEVLLPLPDDAQEHYKDCEFYIVSSGKAKPASYSLVIDSDEIFYASFSLPTYGTYGFVYNDPSSYDDEEDDEDDEDEDDEDEDDEDEDDDDYIDDEDDYEDEDEDEIPTPTNKPTPTLTIKPTKTPKPTSTPVPTKKPTPTKKPSNNSNNSSTGNNGSKKDSIPKTGDSFPLGTLATVGAISGVALITSIIILKKKK